MNYIYCIVTTLSFFTLQQCFAMENKPNTTPANIFHTINTIKKPQSVVYFQGDIIAIEGHEECSIYNIAKKQEIRRINNNDTIKCIAGHPTKPLLAILSRDNRCENYLRIYNASTGHKITELHKSLLQGPLAFNPMDDTIIALSYSNIFHIYNHTTLNEQKTFNLAINNQRLITFYSTANECALYATNQMFFINTKDTFDVTRSTNFLNPMPPTALIYNPKGSLICNTNQKKYYIFDSFLTQKSYNGNFKALAINPTNLILAGLSVKNECIDYINTQKNGAIIASTNLKTFNIAHFCHQQYIQFSSDGKRIIIVGNDACYVLEVHFDALYQPGTKEKCITALCARQNYFEKNNQILPQDIKHLLIRYLLDVCKYSFTNH